MSNTKEYIVTAIDHQVLDDLCNEIEAQRGSSYVPYRAVEVANSRPISRSTHYYLTDSEAETLRKDPRVLAVEPLPQDLNLFPSPAYSQTESTWNKSSSNTNTHKNWGLLRVFEGVNRSNWGSNGTANQSGTINIEPSGKNVDIIIVDGLFDPLHPEFRVNSDGTGATRVNQYNWYQHNPEVTGAAPGNYVYTPYTGTSAESNNNHGAHVAGTAAGNSQGWARSATVYNIYPYGLNPSPLFIFDYIRAFHKSKPINPQTGVRNPTIVNNSWGYRANPDYTTISSVSYRGTVYSGPFTKSQLNNFGIYVDNSDKALLSSRYTAIDADIEDAIAEGIIILGAAGNNYQKIDIPSGQDYDNYATVNSINYYYNRGMSPAAAPSVICVGSISALTNESKNLSSNCGPRLDIFAPGSNIMSSFNSTASFGGTTDPRSSSYYIGKISGTSMASPQVCGLLACVLEIYPNMTQSQALEYIVKYSGLNQITATTGGPSDYTDLQGSPNRFLAYKKERLNDGTVYPKLNYKARPDSGITFPRTRIQRFGG